MRVEIYAPNADTPLAIFIFEHGEFESVSPGRWVDEGGDPVGPEYRKALVDLAEAVSEDAFIPTYDRQVAAAAMFVA